MKTEASPKVRQTDRKRAAILNAAVKAFTERGFDLTSMDHIAESARVSKRTVYNHFASKEALFEAILGEMVAQADVLPSFPYESGKSIENQLFRIGLQIAETVSNDSFLNLARIVVARAISAPEFAKVLSERTRVLDQRLVDWLRQAVKDKRLRLRKPQLAAEHFLSMLLSYAFWPRLLGIQKRMHVQNEREYVRNCVQMLLTQYGNS